MANASKKAANAVKKETMILHEDAGKAAPEPKSAEESKKMNLDEKVDVLLKGMSTLARNVQRLDDMHKPAPETAVLPEPQPRPTVTTAGTPPARESMPDQTVRQEVIPETENPEVPDDRNEVVEVFYGQAGKTPDGKVLYHTETLPKFQALERLVSWYTPLKNKMIPQPSRKQKNVNASTCYCIIEKRDRETGEKILSYQDMPLWLAATRAMEDKKIVTLIPRNQYLKIHAKRLAQETNWKNTQFAEKKQELLLQVANM
jgi:hypothetical protein